MAKCRLFAIDHNLKEVVPDALYSKHLFGASLSVSVIKFVMPAGPSVEAKSHSHGEEASLQIRGSSSVFLGLGERGTDREFRTAEGEATLIPAQTMHYGTNKFDAGGVCLRFNVVTPARMEFGPESSTTYYPLKSKA